MYNFSFSIPDFGDAMIILICATSKNWVIGKDQKIPWNFKSDMSYFKKLTMNHIVVFGRKTFESIGKELEGRKIFVLTRNRSYSPENSSVIHSPSDILNNFLKNKEKCFIGGGGEIYNLFIDYARLIYLTIIDKEFDGDTFFPLEKLSCFREVYCKNIMEKETNLKFKIFKRT